MSYFVICGAIGIFAGLLGGLLGIGGSIVMIPALTEAFGPQQHLYQAAAMIVNFFVVVPAAIQHMRAKAVMGAVVARMVPLAVVCVVIGVSTSELPVFRDGGQGYLMLLFAAFLLYAGFQNTRRVFNPKFGEVETVDPKARPWKIGLEAGVPTGFVAGLLGVGGGIVAVPVQNRLLGIPLRNSIANSATTIIALSVVGAIGKNYALAVDHPEYTVLQSLELAAVLIPTAIVGSLIGSHLTHALPVRIVRGILVLLLLAAAIRMATSGYAVLS